MATFLPSLLSSPLGALPLGLTSSNLWSMWNPRLSAPCSPDDRFQPEAMRAEGCLKLCSWQVSFEKKIWPQPLPSSTVLLTSRELWALTTAPHIAFVGIWGPQPRPSANFCGSHP